MNIRIALAGNPNSGKTTLFNALTGSNQFVGNWPGVTVEKKEGKLKERDGIIVTDLPGIYSLSPYTLEEVVARNYLVGERPDAILNIVDGTNLERNLYLTTQLIELGIPLVIALNMADIVRKNGDIIDIERLSKHLKCPIVEISALREEGIAEAIELAISAAMSKTSTPAHAFSGEVEHTLAHIEEATVHGMPADRQRWYAVKIFERDEKVLSELGISEETLAHIENDIRLTEEILEDDAESIIINERYEYIERLIWKCVIKKNAGKPTVSDKIDSVVINRFLALPIFAAIMFLVYYISVSTVGAWATDWANDGLFGDGFHFIGIGCEAYEEALHSYGDEMLFEQNADMADILSAAEKSEITGASELKESFDSRDYKGFIENYMSFGEVLEYDGYSITERVEAVIAGEPSPESFGAWIPGVPVLAERGLDAIDMHEAWLRSLILDGIIGGVGAVLGFVPQMIVLFVFLSFLEACGYMSRIAFMMDKLFRKLGLSGKSFIPLLVGTGCGVPGIMCSRTIENERDRRMTVITTTFIPCGAKLPIIALIASALFGGAWWVAPSAYFLGMVAVAVSGMMLKKTKLFAGDPAPFVLELPAYHMPTPSSLFSATWERSASFIKKAGTVILLSSIVLWVGSRFGFVGGRLAFALELPLESSLLGYVGRATSWMFAPLGFGTIKAAVASFMGLIAKEEIVAVFGVLDFESMGQLAGYSFLAFNLLCAPCFAAMGAIRREMNSAKWTAIAIGYQCVFAYSVSLMIYQLGSALGGNIDLVGVAFASAVAIFMIYMLARKQKKV